MSHRIGHTILCMRVNRERERVEEQTIKDQRARQEQSES
jgi:hypothetical protein